MPTLQRIALDPKPKAAVIAAPWLARARVALAIVTLAAVAALTYIRLYFGVDFTDESFYTAVPYRFVLGARPLIDETNLVQQAPGVLLYPFVTFWNSVVGLDGIILYARHLHFLFSAAVAFALFVSLRRILGDRSLSAVLAAAAVAFVPFGIHGLSYNTFSTGFFAAGCFLGAAWVSDGSRRLLAAAGAAQGLAVFTYPPFALPVGCFFIALYLNSRPRSLRSIAPALLPAATGVTATLVFFLHEGGGTIQDLVQRTSEFGDQGGGVGELAELLSFVFTTFTYKYVAAALLLAALALRAWKAWTAVLPLLVLPLAALPADLGTSTSSNVFVTNAAVLAPGVFLLRRDCAAARRLLAIVWLPAVAAGLTTALSSANGGINIAIGSFPAMIVTGALLGLAIQGAMRDVVSPIDLLPAVAFVAIGVAFQYLNVYRDAGLRDLTIRVSSGAYAGIHTTPQKRDFLSALDRDLIAVSGPNCRIVFYHGFPAGYLLGHGRPATNATWLLDVDNDQEARYQDLLLDYYKQQGWLPDVVVRLDVIPSARTAGAPQKYAATEPLERTLGGARYVNTRSGHGYTIRRLRGHTCRES